VIETAEVDLVFSVSSVSAAAAAPIPRPGPVPQPTPLISTSSAPLMRADVVARPNAKPSPGEPNLTPPESSAGLPVLVAAGLIAGGVAVIVPPLEVAGGAIAGAVDSLGAALGRGSAFTSAAAREFATQYREDASAAAGLKFADPHELGRAAGAQAWLATEELLRSAVVGAGLAGGAWAAEKAAAQARLLAPNSTHAVRQ
jgi:hypothetical protein